MIDQNTFENLRVWQLSRELNKQLFDINKTGAFQKDYPLISQINRSCGSIMDNIAEGFERNGKREFVQFLSISKGSCGEFKSQLIRAKDRQYLDEKQFEELFGKANSISKMTSKLIAAIMKSENRGWKFES